MVLLLPVTLSIFPLHNFHTRRLLRVLRKRFKILVLLPNYILHPKHKRCNIPKYSTCCTRCFMTQKLRKIPRERFSTKSWALSWNNPILRKWQLGSMEKHLQVSKCLIKTKSRYWSRFAQIKNMEKSIKTLLCKRSSVMTSLIWHSIQNWLVRQRCLTRSKS